MELTAATKKRCGIVETDYRTAVLARRAAKLRTHTTEPRRVGNPEVIELNVGDGRIRYFESARTIGRTSKRMASRLRKNA